LQQGHLINEDVPAPTPQRFTDYGPAHVEFFCRFFFLRELVAKGKIVAHDFGNYPLRCVLGVSSSIDPIEHCSLRHPAFSRADYG